MGPCAIWLRDGVARLRLVAGLLSLPRLFVLLGGRPVLHAGRLSSRFRTLQSVHLRPGRDLATRLIVLGSKVSPEIPGLRGFSFVDVDLDPLSASGL